MDYKRITYHLTIAFIFVFVSTISYMIYAVIYFYLETKEVKNTFFHSDSVIGFSFKTANKEFVFKRKNRLSEWTPKVDVRFIQKRLNLLSKLYDKKISN